MHRFTGLGLLLLVACTAKPAQVVRELADAPEAALLGETHRGRLKWLSANARFVALYIHPDAKPELEHLFPTPTDLVLFDTIRGTRESLQEVVATDPRGRYAVALAGPHLWLFDAETGTREDLAARGADLGGDRMRCYGGRQAAFDPWGAELLYLRTGPDRAVVRRLATGEEHEVPALPHRVWRAEPTGAPGWVRFHVVPRDTDGDGALTYPWRDHACEAWMDWDNCHDCMMMPPAWEGDRDAIVLAHVDGSRVFAGFGAQPEPLERERGALWYAFGPDAFGLLGDADTVVHADGSALAPPAGCQWTLSHDLPVALMKCEDGVRIFRPQTGTAQSIPGLRGIAMRPALDASGALWSAAWVTVDGNDRFGRLRLDDGRLELDNNPLELTRDESRISQDRRGWLLGGPERWEGPGRDSYAYDISTGRARRLPGDTHTSHSGLVQRNGRYIAVDLEGGQALPLPDKPAAVAENGCALLEPPEDATAGSGSWTLLCPPGGPLRRDAPG